MTAAAKIFGQPSADNDNVVPLSDKLSTRRPSDPPSWIGAANDVTPRALFAPPPATLPPEPPALPDPAQDPEYQRRLAELRARAEEEGRAAGQAQVEAACSRYLDGLARLERVTREASRPAATEVVGLALVVARELLQRELRVDREALVTNVETAIEAAGRESPVRVRMARADLEYIARKRKDLVDGGLQLLEDAAITPGGCVVETARRVVDATLEARLAAVETALVQALDTEAGAVDRERGLAVIAGGTVA